MNEKLKQIHFGDVILFDSNEFYELNEKLVDQSSMRQHNHRSRVHPTVSSVLKLINCSLFCSPTARIACLFARISPIVRVKHIPSITLASKSNETIGQRMISIKIDENRCSKTPVSLHRRNEVEAIKVHLSDYFKVILLFII